MSFFDYIDTLEDNRTDINKEYELADQTGELGPRVVGKLAQEAFNNSFILFIASDVVEPDQHLTDKLVVF